MMAHFPLTAVRNRALTEALCARRQNPCIFRSTSVMCPRVSATFINPLLNSHRFHREDVTVQPRLAIRGQWELLRSQCIGITCKNQALLADSFSGKVKKPADFTIRNARPFPLHSLDFSPGRQTSGSHRPGKVSFLQAAKGEFFFGKVLNSGTSSVQV